MRQISTLFLCLAFFFVACDKENRHYKLDEVPIQLGEEVQLCLNQPGVLIADGLEITLVDVPTDQRCPEGVYCLLPSFATMVVQVSNGPQIQMDTTIGGSPIEAFGHNYTILNLLPEVQLGSVIEQEDYKISIVVE